MLADRVPVSTSVWLSILAMLEIIERLALKSIIILYTEQGKYNQVSTSRIQQSTNDDDDGRK